MESDKPQIEIKEESEFFKILETSANTIKGLPQVWTQIIQDSIKSITDQWVNEF